MVKKSCKCTVILKFSRLLLVNASAPSSSSFFTWLLESSVQRCKQLFDPGLLLPENRIVWVAGDLGAARSWFRRSLVAREGRKGGALEGQGKIRV